MRKILTIVCALAILAWAGQAWGVLPQHYYFTNADGDSLWLNPNNWLAEDFTTGVPNDYEDDNAWIGDGLTVQLRDGPAPGPQIATPKRLRLGISDGTAGTLEMYAGSHLDLLPGWARYGYIGNNGVGFGDGHVIQYGGLYTASGFGLGGSGATGTWDISGGTIYCLGSSAIRMASGRNGTGSTGLMTQTGGIVSVNCDGEDASSLSIVATDWVGNMHDNTGAYTISGGVLNVNGDRVGNGAIILGPYNANCSGNRATFHVIGSWDQKTYSGWVVDNIKVNGFRMYNAGTDNLATLIYDIDGTVGIEKIIVINAAAFAGKLEVNTIGSDLHAGTYTLMTYASATGDFDETVLPGGWTYNIGTTELTVTVPEPATLVLLGLGGLGVLIRRKRR